MHDPLQTIAAPALLTCSKVYSSKQAEIAEATNNGALLHKKSVLHDLGVATL